MFRRSIKLIFGVSLLIGFSLFPTAKSQAAIDFIDPAIPTGTKLVYQVEEQKNDYEYHIYIDVISTKEGEAYLISTYTPLGTEESARSQSVYLKDPFLPLSCTESYQYKPNDFHFYKAIHWDWLAKRADFEELHQDKDKNDCKKYSKSWENEPSFDLSLVYSGLLNGLPVDEKRQNGKLKLSGGSISVDVDFRTVTTETISMAGRNWFCYKIEATPDLGFLLNWLKFFLGDPKSYFWLTTDKPKVVVRAHIKTPWYERKAELKKVTFSKIN